MKTIVFLSLIGASLAAPTATIETRQLGSFGSGSALGTLSSLLPSRGSSSSGSSTGGLGALSSLLPSIPNLGSGSSSSSTGGLGLPSAIDIPGLGDIDEFTRKAKRQLGGLSSTTENGVTDNTGCQPLTFVFARGTGELGNMGSVVGPEVATQLKSLTGSKVTVQGVNYAADIAGDAEMGASGGPVMASLVEQALKQCPNTTVVLGGYSEGAMAVHNAAGKLTAKQVAAAVLFGDPLKMESVGRLASADVKEFCATGDPVCENGANGMAHLTYGSDAKAAARFLVTASGVSTSS